MQSVFGRESASPASGATSPRVVVLFGGTSSERRVSVASAQNLCRALPGAALHFIALSGAVHVCREDVLMAHDRPFEQDFESGVAARWAGVEEALDASPHDAVYVIALHGGEGENGTLQAALERRRLAFTGSGARASADAFDKTRAKAAALRYGIHVAKGRVVEGDAAAIEQEIGSMRIDVGDLVAKPVADGSSIGLHFVRSNADVRRIARAVAAARVPYLVEELVCGTELTIGVVENGPRCVSLPPSEVRVDDGGMFDFAGKYLGKGTREITPAEVPQHVADSAARVAITAHRALGCEGYSRTDVIATADGIVFIEINTLPGLTRASFIPQQLAAADRSFGDFVRQQIELAMVRRDR